MLPATELTDLVLIEFFFQSDYALCQHVPRMLSAKQKKWLFSVFEEGKQRFTSAHHSHKHPSCWTLSPARNRPGNPVFIICYLQEVKLLAWPLSPLCWPRARKLKRQGKGTLHMYLGKQISEDPWCDPKSHQRHRAWQWASQFGFLPKSQALSWTTNSNDRFQIYSIGRWKLNWGNPTDTYLISFIFNYTGSGWINFHYKHSGNTNFKKLLKV